MKEVKVQQYSFSAVGAFVLMLAIIAGAFGAHGLRSTLPAHAMAIYEKAVFYQVLQGIGLLVLPLMPISPKSLQAIGLLFLGGILLFSGSLYALSITGIGAFGMITPLGGISFIIGWFVLGLRLWRN